MKKMFVLMMLAFLPFFVFGQVPEPPADLCGLWEWFKAGLTTWPGALAVILLLTEKIKRMLSLKGLPAVVLSWGLAVPLSFIGYYFNIGIFDNVEWYIGLIYAISFSISANLAYLMPFIKEGTRILIDWIDSRNEAKIHKK